MVREKQLTNGITMQNKAAVAAKGKLSLAAIDNEAAGDGLVTTLERGLRILGAFRAEDRGPITNGDIAQRCGLHKATVSRLTSTLEKLGYVARDAKTGGYSLGPSILRAAHVYLSHFDVRSIARPLMQQLADESEVVVALSISDGLEMVTIETVVGRSPLQLRVSIGSRVPIAQTAIGHAFLAGLSPRSYEALIQHLRAAFATEWRKVQDFVLRDIEMVRKKGYCISLGEWHHQINGVAVPIVVDPDSLVLGLSCGALARTVQRNELAVLGEKLVAARGEIEQALGRNLEKI